MVLGIIGGVLGMIVGFFVYGYVEFVDWFAAEMPDVDLLEQADNPVQLQAVGLIAPLLAIAGGAMAHLRPAVAACLLVIACIGQFWGFGFGVFTMFPIAMTGLAALFGLLGLLTKEPGTL
jgi:hypothetical protein